MIEIEIPGRQTIKAQHAVFDYNGTIAVDGKLIEGVAERIQELSTQVKVHVLTADTYGSAATQCANLPLQVHTFPRAEAAACKREIVQGLEGGAICFGNGFNDVSMFEIATLSIAILDGEGMFAGLLRETDILARSATEAIDLLLKPSHVKATLRS